MQLFTWHLMVLLTPRNSITLLLRHVVMSATSTHYAVCAPIAKWHVCCFMFSPSLLQLACFSGKLVLSSLLFLLLFLLQLLLLRLSSHHHLSSKLFNFCFSLLHFVPDLTGLFVTLELTVVLVSVCGADDATELATWTTSVPIPNKCSSIFGLAFLSSTFA